jgi:hypothetical protein
MTRKAKVGYTRWDGITSDMLNVARRRTSFLMDGPEKMMPIPDLLANAYLQGVNDTAETVIRQEQNKPETRIPEQAPEQLPSADRGAG